MFRMIVAGKIPLFCFFGFFVMTGEPSPRIECTVLVIDTIFTCKDPKTQLPCGWRGLKKDVSMFSLLEENGDHFVRNSARNTATAIGKPVRFNAAVMPYLKWRWRVRALPAGGNEKNKRKADSGAGVYVIFKGPYLFNKLIKYSWSSTLPRGTITKSPFHSAVNIIVLRSGHDSLDTWIDETVNVYEDFKTIFHRAPPVVEGIAIMSDSDNTNSFAEADYSDFLVSDCK